MGARFDAALLHAWSAACVTDLRRVCARLDDLNVFPVPDGDTGTNLLLTLAEGAHELGVVLADAAGRAGAAAAGAGGAGSGVAVGTAADALLRGALVGARGSSGVIVSQYLRGLLHALVGPSHPTVPPGDAPGREAVRVDGPGLVLALHEAADAAYAAVGSPVEGTVLTVARAVAAGSADAGGDAAPAAVLAHGLAAGRRALARTPDQLPALRDAGVLDAGGAGLLTVLAALLACLAPDAARDVHVPAPRDAVPGAAGHAADAHGPAGHPGGATTPDALRARHGGEFEVMYVVTDDASPAPGVPADGRPGGLPEDDLRAALGRVGDSVAVVGGGGLWQAHVHTDDVVGALAAATAPPGPPLRVSQVRVRHLATQAGVHGAHRPLVGLVAVTRASGLVADLARAGAVVVLVAPGARAGDEVRRAAEDTGARDVVVLAVEGSAGAVAPGATDGAPRTVLVADLAEAQLVAGAATLASLPPRDPSATVRALVAAVRAVRTRVVGDVGGGGQADAVLDAARDLLGRTGVLLTALTGDATPPSVAQALVSGLGTSHPAVDVVVLPSGAPGADVELAAEDDPDAPPSG